ncbi:hypothetical protein [Corynebacterium sp.]|uniref:hypothetical protein n=1 Tax=Corynebacterium sp. TaxID=1720 RepID=UPI0026DCB941|nr:hypothetical protein [Corynebacterium sp.]
MVRFINKAKDFPHHPHAALGLSDLNDLCDSCLHLELFQHLDLSSSRMCCDFLELTGFCTHVEQEKYVEFILDFCLQHVAAAEVKQKAAYAHTLLKVPGRFQEVVPSTRAFETAATPVMKLAELLADSDFLNSWICESDWDPWDEEIFSLLITIDHDLPYNFFTRLSRKWSLSHYAHNH